VRSLAHLPYLCYKFDDGKSTCILPQRIAAVATFRLFTFYCCCSQGPPRAARAAVDAQAMCPALEASRESRQAGRQAGRQAASE
jgi:hypothetical protein